MKPWYTAAGRIGGASLFSEVITEKVEAPRALADSEARFRAMFENAAVGVAHAAPDGRWLRVNQALCRIVGQPADSFLPKRSRTLPTLMISLARERKIDSYVVDKRYPRRDRTLVWVRKTVGCVRKDDGSIDYFVSVMEDIFRAETCRGVAAAPGGPIRSVARCDFYLEDRRRYHVLESGC